MRKSNRLILRPRKHDYASAFNSFFPCYSFFVRLPTLKSNHGAQFAIPVKQTRSKCVDIINLPINMFTGYGSAPISRLLFKGGPVLTTNLRA